MAKVNRTVRLGGRDVTRMGMGTNRLTPTPDNIEHVRQAVGAGIGMIDTAHLYSSGASEVAVGEALASVTADARPIVATKGGYAHGDGRPEALRAQIEHSLRSLRTKQIDLYYLHRVDPGTPLEDSVAVLAEFRARGAIRDVGLSQVSIEQVDRAREIVPIAAVQNQYNVADRALDGLVDYCTHEGIVFVAFYPLHGEHAELDRVASALGATRPQVALAWLLHRSPNILPIPGSLTTAHVLENVAALDIELSDEDFEALSATADADSK